MHFTIRLIVLCAALHLPAHAATSHRPAPLSKALALELADSDQPPIRGIIKFVEGSDIRAYGRTLSSPPHRPDTAAELDIVRRTLARYGRVTAPLFGNLEPIERLGLRVRDPDALADLQLYVAFETSNLPARDWLGLMREINRSPVVEVAYLESPDSITTAHWTGGIDTITLPGFTPSLTHLQGYLKPAPAGIDAATAWSRPGGTGAGIRIMVYDNSFRNSHEDVPATFYVHGENAVDDSHGSAVMGIVGGRDNGFGIKGIAHGAQFGFHGAASAFESHAEHLLLAGMQLDAGDVLLTEVGKKVNALGFGCACNPTQANSVPLEFYPAEFDVISTLTAIGITVVETAGNGCVDFDSDVFEDKFSSSAGDSGAIWVAASEALERSPMCYTNFGSRIDLHAWGESVVTLSYLRENEVPVFDKGPDRLYVPNFGGTSSAGAIVAGAVASVQGQASVMQGQPLAPAFARQLLMETGTPQTKGFERTIGPMPNLHAIDFE